MFETRYITIHRVPGVKGLLAGNTVDILPAHIDGTRAFITLETVEWYLHLRRVAAFSNMVFEALGFTNDVAAGTTPAERFERILSRTSIKESEHNDTLLIVEVIGHAECLRLENLLSLGEVGAGIELFNFELQATMATKALRAAFAGLSLALPRQTTDELHLLGTVAYAIEPCSGRMLYSTRIRGSASATISSKLDLNANSDATAMAQRIKASAELENVARLLLLSSTQRDDKLISFLAAWAGLELFIQYTFKNIYEPQFHKLLQATALSAVGSTLKRIQVVMKDKYNIRDKFVIVASALDDVEVDVDIEIFKELKERRDDLAHAMKGDLDTLPSDTTRALLRKYLRLHLGS